jgi:predicted GNAT family acetyltransferase
VACLSQSQLDAGKRFCVLYTDLANPTSNRIYTRLGYRHLYDAVFLSLVGGSGGTTP